MSARSTFSVVADHLIDLFAPLLTALEDDQAFRALFARLGWSVDGVPAGYAGLAGPLRTAVAALDGLPDDAGLDDVGPLLQAIKSFHDQLTVAPSPAGVSATPAELAGSLVDLLLADHLSREAAQVFRILLAFGIATIEYTAESTSTGRPEYTRTNLQWTELEKILTAPASIAGKVYGWGTENFDFGIAAGDLLEILSAFGVRAELRRLDDPDDRQQFLTDQTNLAVQDNVALDAFFMDGVVDDVPVNFGVSMLALAAEGGMQAGFVVQPLVPTTVHDTIPLTDTLNLTLSGQTNFDTAFGVLVRPGEDVQFRQPFQTGSVPLTGEAKVNLVATFAPPFVLIGRPSASRLEIGGVTAGVGFRGATSGTPEVRLELAFSGTRAVIQGSDGDGFLDDALGGKSVSVPLDFGIRWSSVSGLSFTGAGGFEVTLPINVALGPISVSSIDLAVAGETRPSGAGALALQAGAALSVALGPVDVVVDGVGVSFDIGFESGNAGPFSISAGLKAPTGLGVSVDAGPVSGGGFLTFDPANHRYGGALELQVYSIGVKAFGLVETQLPTGPGYSFVIIISAEFTPIQLGLGFTLTGVGGLVGINRTVDAAQLTAAVLKGNLDAILFPHDVVQNAPTLIHDLQAFFPAAKGRYVFGPLAEIGWGTPTLVEGKLGLLLELPGPILTIIGNIQAHLPKSAPGGAALVNLNIDISGQLDFPKKHFELDGALHDSKVGDYPVSGAMAMRLDWGDNPSFAISLGGFNPTFNPPSGFPPLHRITVDLGLTKNPRVTLSGYMALTSNTAQIGASLDAWASKYGATLTGTLAFDALFVFSPFSFDVELHGGVSVSFHDFGGTLQFHGRISGPSPWRITGSVCVQPALRVGLRRVQRDARELLAASPASSRSLEGRSAERGAQRPDGPRPPARHPGCPELVGSAAHGGLGGGDLRGREGRRSHPGRSARRRHVPAEVGALRLSDHALRRHEAVQSRCHQHLDRQGRHDGAATARDGSRSRLLRSGAIPEHVDGGEALEPVVRDAARRLLDAEPGGDLGRRAAAHADLRHHGARRERQRRDASAPLHADPAPPLGHGHGRGSEPARAAIHRDGAIHRSAHAAEGDRGVADLRRHQQNRAHGRLGRPREARVQRASLARR